MSSVESVAGSVRHELPHLSDAEASELAQAIERLIVVLRPERIYVFGSRARGSKNEESDVDLLVIVPHSELPPHRQDQIAYRAVGRHSIPLDIMVMTREEFERRCRAPSSLPAVVLREGRTLYAA